MKLTVWLLLGAGLLQLTGEVQGYEFGEEVRFRGSLHHLLVSDAITLLDMPVVAGYRGIGFESGFIRQYELSDLDRVYLAGSYARRSVALAVGVSQFGKSSLFAEQRAKISLHYRISNFTAAVSGSALRQQFGGGYESLQASTVGVGIGWSNRQTAVAVSGENLTSPWLVEGITEKPLVQLEASRQLASGLVSSAGVRMQSSLAPRWHLGQAIDISENARIGWQIETRPLVYGAAFRLVPERFLLQYAVSIHPTLGLSHLISLGFVGK